MYSPESRSSFPGSPPVGQHPYSKLFVFFADAAAARIAQAAASVHLSERQPATGCDSGIQHHRRTFRRERRETDVASTYQRHSAGTDLRAVNRPGFPGECFICELRLPDHRLRTPYTEVYWQ